jgi:hypothetical protein
METKVNTYVSGGNSADSRSTNIWQFLARNEKGSTFELPLNHQFDEESIPGNALSKKYITLNQVNVNVTGSKDKLLIVRDVTHIIYLE